MVPVIYVSYDVSQREVNPQGQAGAVTVRLIAVGAGGIEKPHPQRGNMDPDERVPGTRRILHSQSSRDPFHPQPPGTALDIGREAQPGGQGEVAA